MNVTKSFIKSDILNINVTSQHEPLFKVELPPGALAVRHLKHTLCHAIIPMDIMPLLEEKQLVTDMERERIKCKTDNNGNISGADELLDTIIRREFWHQFIEILKHEDVKLPNIAEQLMKEKEKIENEREIEEDRKQKEKCEAAKETETKNQQEETISSKTGIGVMETTQPSEENTPVCLELEPIVTRRYQIRLAQPGIEGRNVIVCAPTGSGKTMIASLIAKAHMSKMTKQGRKAYILYLVPRFAILQHIYSEISKNIPLAKLGYRCGGFQSNQPFDIMFNDNEIVIATADIFRNSLAFQEMSISDISLLLFDECHYTMDKHPYNKIMYEYLKLKKTGSQELPQLAGFTASPGAGGNVDINKAFEHILKLCSNLDCQVFSTVPNELAGELEEHIHRPTKHSYVVFPDYNSPVARLLIQAMEKIERCTFNKEVLGVQKGTPQYESKVEQTRKDNPEDVSQHIYIDHLVKYNTALRLLFATTEAAAFSCLKSVYEAFKTRTRLLPDEQKLWDIFKECVRLHSTECAETHTNEGLSYLMAALKQHDCDMKCNLKEIRGMIFVRTVAEANALKTWMETDEDMEKYNAAVITGSDSMTKPQQKEITDSFNNGLHKVILSTTLMSEGVDIVDCNLVVCYHFVTNEIFMIQCRGRARALNSKFIVIGMQQTSKKDLLNMSIEGTMNEAILKLKGLPNEQFRNLIEDKQNLIIQEWEKMNKAKEVLQSKNNASEVELLCTTCPPGENHVCYVSDITCYKEAHYINMTDSFMEKIKLSEEDTPIKKRKMGLTRFGCAKCGNNWGHIISDLPCLALKSFKIKIKGNVVPKIKQWSKVPCKVREYYAE